MAQQPIDYAALAEQARSAAPPAVDYAALADQARTQTQTPTFHSENEKDANGDAVVESLSAWLPALGGTVGGLVGGIPGALLGGAAAHGYSQLMRHARELAPAVADVARNLVAEPMATLGGFAHGAAAGALGATEDAAIQGAAQGAGALIGKGASMIGSRMMQSAVKPGLKLLIKKGAPVDVPQVVRTLLTDGINVTPGGVAKLQRLLTANRAEISAALAPVAQTELPALKVAGRLTDVAQRFGNQVNPQADLEAISAVGQNFLEHPAITSRGTIPIESAQALKQGTYQVLSNKYGEAGAATIEAEKALARGLKEDIAAEVPGLDALNERQGNLITALDAVGRRVALSGNRDPIGFAWAAHNPTAFLAALIDRSPAVKSLLARGLFNHAGQVAQVPPALLRVAVHAMTSEDPGTALAMSDDQSNPR